MIPSLRCLLSMSTLGSSPLRRCDYKDKSINDTLRFGFGDRRKWYFIYIYFQLYSTLATLNTAAGNEIFLRDLHGEESIEHLSESVDELREKLANMKRMMGERKGSTLGDLSTARKRKETSDIIDGNFLSWIFISALIVILSVSFYAFYTLYHAVLKKFPSHHTEL